MPHARSQLKTTIWSLLENAVSIAAQREVRNGQNSSQNNEETAAP
jgi:hypothetical protein